MRLSLRQAPATALLLGLILVGFGLEVLAGGSTDPEVLLRLGANQPERVWAGEWWRLAASMFLHIGLLHLLLNGWALYQLGFVFELLTGPARLLATFLATGVIGSLASILWKGQGIAGNPEGLSAGASGAIFGLLGGLVAFLLRRRDRLLPPAKALLGQLLFWAAINVFLGFTIPAIDNAAHLGGLAAGLVLGLGLRERGRRRPPPATMSSSG